jgi:YfiR/HmsC-like
MTHIHSTRSSVHDQPKIFDDWLMCRHGMRLSATLVVVAWMSIGVAKLTGQQAKPGEYQVKAAYLYNFARFVEWPEKTAADASNGFTICVLGQNPFGGALSSTFANETINGKSVVARSIPDSSEAAKCRILFISASEGDRLRQILATVRDASVLTVSDLPQFSHSGGMVQFTMEGSHVRFEVNLAPAERAGLVLSSELLKVAVNVRRESALGD